MKNAILLLLACLLSLSVSGQEAVHVTGARVTEVGIYESQVLTSATNADGVRLQGLNDFKLVTSTTKIPARIGIRFGFRYEILGTPTNAALMLTMVVKHPPAKSPVTGKTTIEESYPLQSWLGKTYTSASLDDEDDLVIGQQTFQVWYEGRKLCEQSFDVVPDKSQQAQKKP